MFTYFNEINKKFIPQALSDLGLDAGNIVNAILLSHLSPDEDSSAAAAIIFTTQIAIVVIPSAFLYVITPVMNYRMPSHKSSVITASILFSLLLSLPGFCLSFFMGTLFLKMGVQASVCDIVDEYFFVFSISMPFWMVATALNKTAMPLKHERLMYIESLINFVCITGFSSVFVDVYPLLYFSPVQTIALSYTLCSMTRIMLYGFAYKKMNEFESWENVNFSRYKEAMGYMFSMGWKLCVQLMSELSALYFLTILASVLLPNDTMNLDVLNVMIQCFSFSIIITLAMAITAINIVSELCQNKRYDAVKSRVNVLLIMSTLYNSVLFIVTMAIPNNIIGLFMDSRDNTNTGLSGDFRMLFVITFLGLVFNAYKDILNMADRSLNLYSLPMKVSVGGVWGMGIPLAIIFAACTNLGIGGLWLGYNIGNIITGIFLLCHWHLVNQPNVVETLSANDTNVVNDMDTLSFCLREYKERFFSSCFGNQEPTSRAQLMANHA